MIGKRWLRSRLGDRDDSAVAAGAANGGYDDVVTASRHMAHLRDTTYAPNEQNHAVYRELYAEYETLHDYFGRGANDVMKRLKKIKTGTSAR